MALQVVIPTYRRMPRQATLGNLPQAWRERTTLVVDEADAKLEKLYDLQGARLLVHPPEIDTIAKKRAWILRQPQFGCLVMFDDDLRFAVRGAGNSTKLWAAKPDDVDGHLRALEDLLESGAYAHAGWSARQGNNHHDAGGWDVSGSRQMYCLGYDADRIRDLEALGRIQLGRIQTREDMDLTLQLLRLGLVNAVDFDITCDQVAGFAAKGGCTEERTLESSNRDAVRLAELHPGLVKVVEKKYKGSLNRKEVVVSWKKAFDQGLQYAGQVMP